MTTGTITSLGIGSSIDLQGMLDTQREADEAILDLDLQKIEEQEAVQMELETVNALLFSTKTNTLNLSLTSNYLYREVSTSAPEVATATAQDGAETGTYRVEVTSLASQSSYMSEGTSSATASVYVPTIQESIEGFEDTDTSIVLAEGETIIISCGPEEDPKFIVITGTEGGMTMDEIVDVVNLSPSNQDSSGNSLVTASTIVDPEGQSHLCIAASSGETGETNRVEVTNSGSGMGFSAQTTEFAYTMGEGSDIYSIQVSADTSLETLANMINADENNPGVTASVIDTGIGDNPYKLALESDQTGEDSRIDIVSSLTDLAMDEQNGDGYTMEADQAISFEDPVVITALNDNNTIVFQEDSGDGYSQDLTAIIPDGVYDTPEELAKAVELALETESSANGNWADYQVTIDPWTGKLSIQEAGALENMTVKWDDQSSTAADTLGFSQTKTITPTGSSLNAEIIIDNVTYQRQENDNLTDLINGATFNLYSTGVSYIDIQEDISTIEQEILLMVETFNELLAEVDANDDYDEATGTWGTLAQSSSVNNLEYEMFNILGTIIDTGTGITSLYDLGLEVNQDGTISIDEDELNSILSENFEDVQTLLLGTDSFTGLADILNDKLGQYVLSNGYINSEIDALDENIARMEADYAQSMELLDKKYDILASQYSELDSYLAQMEAEQNTFAEMISALTSED